MYEAMLECPLSACFRSSRYPIPATHAMAIGIAVHSVLEQLPVDARAWPPDQDAREFRRHARNLFDEILDQISEDALHSPRQRPVSTKDNRGHQARKGVMRAATRLLQGARAGSGGGSRLPELRLDDPNGVVLGRPDLIIEAAAGAKIIDFKTGSFSKDESLEKFERQLMLYAYLWHANSRDWPTEATAVNPLTGRRYGIDIDPDRCTELAAHIEQLVASIQESSFEHLAETGRQCQRCDYRPWCDPYWSSSSSDGETDYDGFVISCEIAQSAGATSTSGWLNLRTPTADIAFTVRQASGELVDLRNGSTIRIIQAWTPPGSTAKVISGYSDVIVIDDRAGETRPAHS